MPIRVFTSFRGSSPLHWIDYTTMISFSKLGGAIDQIHLWVLKAATVKDKKFLHILFVFPFFYSRASRRSIVLLFLRIRVFASHGRKRKTLLAVYSWSYCWDQVTSPHSSRLSSHEKWLCSMLRESKHWLFLFLYWERSFLWSEIFPIRKQSTIKYIYIKTYQTQQFSPASGEEINLKWNIAKRLSMCARIENQLVNKI